MKVEQLGVICPYRNQVTHIKQRLRLHKQQQQQHDIQMPNNDSESIEVSTVDQYQGRDKDVVIISFVRSSNLDMPVGVSGDKSGTLR